MKYMIAYNYLPWKRFPDGLETKVIQDGTWSVFPCREALPKALQDAFAKIWREWLENCKEYKYVENYFVELYTPPQENRDDYYCEIWVPIEKI